MKRLKFNVITTLCLLASVVVSAQSGIEKKITKEFSTNANTQFVIQHKFGDISIENWDQEKIFVEATLIADTKKQEKAEKYFEDVKIDFSTSGDQVKVKTIYDSRFDQKDVKVNYIVRMPNYLALDLINKFGAVFIDEINGKSNLDISYGSLKANKLLYNDSKPLSQLILAYGSAEITKCNWLQIEVKYSSMEMKKAKAIIIDSRFSNIEIDDSHSIIATSKYDNYENGSTQNLVLTSKFTNFEIGNISNKLDLDFEYGSFEAGNIQSGFELIKIENRYGDIELRIEEESSYLLDAHLQYCDLDYPDSGSVNHREDGTHDYYTGRVGNDASTQSKVTIESKYGGVDLD
jgi:hypothetical protein